MNKLIFLALLFFAFAGCSSRAPEPIVEPERSAESKQPVSILAWNVESGGSNLEVIVSQLIELRGYDIYCFSEVAPKNLDILASVFGTNFQSVAGTTGNNIRLQIIFDRTRFELLEQKEMVEYRGFILNNGTHRSPLYVRLRDRNSDKEFIVMTNHLARGNAELRNQQAIGLREWARDQNIGIINIGDFNMDFDFKTERGNDAFLEILRDNIFSWGRPVELIDSNWADPDGDGKDNYPDSMLDFAFVAGPAKDWNPECRVIVRDKDFPDDDFTSDHRPIAVQLVW